MSSSSSFSRISTAWINGLVQLGSSVLAPYLSDKACLMSICVDMILRRCYHACVADRTVDSRGFASSFLDVQWRFEEVTVMMMMRAEVVFHATGSASIDAFITCLVFSNDANEKIEIRDSSGQFATTA
jgi:hypothetical protein